MTTLSISKFSKGNDVRRTVLALLFVFPLSHASSQGIYNTSQLHIHGTMVYVDGEINNEGIVENNGVLSLTGDWKSRGSYAGKGVLEAYGSTAQKITHHGQEVYDLVVNGWGTKYIKGSMRIDHELILNAGIVEVSSGNALILKDGAVISGGSDESYVDGPLTVSGRGYKFFPVGKNGTYAPIEFTNVRGEYAEYSVEVFENAPITSVDNVLVERGLYWQRNDHYGNFGGSPVAIDYERTYFSNPDQMILLAGTNWDEPFATITEVDRFGETDKIASRAPVFTPLILLGEISHEWTDADFYFSTALSPHAAHAENKTVKLFGQRLAREGFRFQVFNRWGELVFENHSLENMTTRGWDGRQMNGKQLMSGTYPYRLTGYDKTGRRLEKSGVITIIY